MSKIFRTALVVFAAGLLVLAGGGAMASAHVRVSGTDVSQGGYGLITFRVPTESDTASTTQLVVTFPDATPFVSVDTQPKAGWTATVGKKPLPSPQTVEGEQVTQYVSTVTWKADNPQAAIAPGSFDTFSVLAGPLPKQDSVSFAAQQTYSDGTVVDWNEKSAPGAAEPEHPAPVLTLPASSGSGGQHVMADGTTMSDGAMDGMDGAMNHSSPSSSTPSWPGIAALVIAILALAAGIANFALLQKKSSQANGESAPRSEN